ncbi:MAG: homoserine O-acetyltransferase [Gemmatimonadota bacterium]
MTRPIIPRMTTRAPELDRPFPAVGVPPPRARIYSHSGPLGLEAGGVLQDPIAAFETWGELDDDRGNAVLVVTGLSPSSHAASHEPGDEPGWWERMIGAGRPIDTDRWFVICANVLGGCHGSTGPSAPDPATGEPYGMRFPFVTLRDLATFQRHLVRSLGIQRLHAACGGSLGGMIALEYAASFPHEVGRVCAMNASGKTYPFAIALHHLQRRAILADPAWLQGDYYAVGQPAAGLALARGIGTVSYRSAAEFERRFGRAWQDGEPLTPGGLFEVESYVSHQAAKYPVTYDANTYLFLSWAMDSHDLGRGRGSFEEGAGGIRADVVLVGTPSDLLTPTWEQAELLAALQRAGREASLFSIDVDTGHDSFLIAVAEFGAPLRQLLES